MSARPSVYERPFIRVLFIDPDGNPQQATYSSSWQMPGISDLVDNKNTDQAQEVKAALNSAMGRFLGAMGCRIVGVEIVRHRLIEAFIEGMA